VCFVYIHGIILGLLQEKNAAQKRQQEVACSLLTYFDAIMSIMESNSTPKRKFPAFAEEQKSQNRKRLSSG